jgi:hypothetical protein
VPGLLVGSQEMVLHVHVMPEPICLCKPYMMFSLINFLLLHYLLQFPHANV